LIISTTYLQVIHELTIVSYLMKKILFFSTSIDATGLNNVLITYANLLSKDYQVSYAYCFEANEELSKFNNSVKTICLHVNRFRKSLPKIISVINTEKPDYLYTGGEPQNVYSIIACKLSRVHPKVIISQHNYLNLEYNPLLHNICYKFYNHADRVIAISTGIYNFLKSKRVKESKMRIVYNPLDVDNVCVKSEYRNDISFDNYIVFIGRISPVKNLYFLVDSFCLLHKDYPELKLLLVGEGVERENLERYVSEKNISTNIIFTGNQVNPYPFLKKARALILPSFSEAVPTVVLESFALGKTVVATPNPGAKDLLKDGKLGYIIDSFDNTQQMADAIKLGLEKPFDADILKKEAMSYSFNEKLREVISDIESII